MAMQNDAEMTGMDMSGPGADSLVVRDARNGPMVAHFVRYNGWPEIKEAFMAGQLSAAYLLAPLAMDLADRGVPLKIVALGHRSGSSPRLYSLFEKKGAPGSAISAICAEGLSTQGAQSPRRRSIEMKHKCPICKMETDSGVHADFPFCSERCRERDLGNWASEKYVVSEAIFTEEDIAEGEGNTIVLKLDDDVDNSNDANN